MFVLDEVNKKLLIDGNTFALSESAEFSKHSPLSLNLQNLSFCFWGFWGPD